MIIYKVTNNINGKIYIGQTIKSLAIRRIQHENRYKYQNDMAISRAIHKYGKNNFSWEIIDTATSIEELNKKESYWIEKLDSLITNGKGYNLKGGGANAYLSEETKQKIGKAQKGKLNHNFGLKGELSKISKPVRNITDNIDYVSERECAEVENVSFKIISAICNGAKGSYKGKIYRFISPEGEIIENDNMVSARKIRKVINLTTNIVYNGVIEASKAYNDKGNNLARQLRKTGYCLWKNCKWKYEDINISIDFIKDKNYRSDSKKVINLDTGKIYDSLNEADKTKYLNKLLKKGNGECIWRNQKWKLI